MRNSTKLPLFIFILILFFGCGTVNQLRNNLANNIKESKLLKDSLDKKNEKLIIMNQRLIEYKYSLKDTTNNYKKIIIELQHKFQIDSLQYQISLRDLDVQKQRECEAKFLEYELISRVAYEKSVGKSFPDTIRFKVEPIGQNKKDAAVSFTYGFDKNIAYADVQISKGKYHTIESDNALSIFIDELQKFIKLHKISPSQIQDGQVTGYADGFNINYPIKYSGEMGAIPPDYVYYSRDYSNDIKMLKTNWNCREILSNEQLAFFRAYYCLWYISKNLPQINKTRISMWTDTTYQLGAKFRKVVIQYFIKDAFSPASEKILSDECNSKDPQCFVVKIISSNKNAEVKYQSIFERSNQIAPKQSLKKIPCEIRVVRGYYYIWLEMNGTKVTSEMNLIHIEKNETITLEEY
jgi:hypothetical protein